MSRSALPTRRRPLVLPAGAELRHAVGVAATLLLPLALLSGRSYGEAVATLVSALFLADRVIVWDWRWVRSPWTAIGLVLWLWIVICSVLQGSVASIVQSVILVRFFLFLPALECWSLRSARNRVWLQWIILACALWIFGEVWHQYIIGENLSGIPRAGDGALTGPFIRPRAGPVYLEVFFPAFLPAILFLTGKPGWPRWVGGLFILGAATATMILIGQRMPSVLLLLGLCATGLLYRQFRLPIVITLVAAAVLLALTPIVSPPTFGKLVVKFSQQMEHFFSTPYGMLFGRAVTMIQAHPWFGLGWDGFKNNCMDPAYLAGISWLPVSDPANVEGCSVHPHNYWTQIGTTAGLPGIVFFAVLVALWLWRISGGSAYRLNLRRGALLVFVIVSMWPIASTTSLFTFPNAGWTFLMIGWGLAESRCPGAAGRFAHWQADSPDPAIAAGPGADPD